MNSLLSTAQAMELHQCLPLHLQFVSWRMVFSTAGHGASLRTLYRSQVGPNIVVVRDSKGKVFGGFACEAWRSQTTAYGAEESFVFTVRASAGSESSATSGQEPSVAPADVAPRDLRVVRVFPYRRGVDRRLNQWGDAEMFGFGQAIVIREDLLRGSSLACESFGTPPLSDGDGECLVSRLECWAVGTESVDVWREWEIGCRPSGD